jgi:hypothetical protein
MQAGKTLFLFHSIEFNLFTAFIIAPTLIATVFQVKTTSPIKNFIKLSVEATILLQFKK